MGKLIIKPGAAGREASILPLCYEGPTLNQILSGSLENNLSKKTDPFLKPLLVLEFKAESILYAVVQRGGVGHVQVAGDTDSQRLAEVVPLLLREHNGLDINCGNVSQP